MTMNATIIRSIKVGVFLALLVLVGMVGLANHTIRAFADTSAAVLHTHEVRDALVATLAGVQTVETGTRGYVITGDSQFLEEYTQGRAATARYLPRLRSLVADNPVQQAKLDILEPLVERKLAVSQHNVATRRAHGLADAVAEVATAEGKDIMDQVREVLANLQSEEDRLLAQRLEASRLSGKETVAMMIGGLGLNGLLVLAVILMIRRDWRLRDEAELLSTQARAFAESIVETVREPLLILTSDLRVNSANRAYYACFQSTPGETEGREFASLAGGIWRQTELLEALGRVLAGTEVNDRELAVEVPGVGRKIFWLSARKLYRPGNHTTMLLLALKDVTAYRDAVQELERFFSLSLDFLCISSADGYFKRVSPAVTDTLGWTVEEFLARPFIDNVHPEDRPATMREVEAQIVEGRKVLSFENRYRHKDGGWRVLSWKSVPQPGGLMYATARDVTERKEHERAYRQLHFDLQRHARELEAANAELEAFSYSVSHDLRAPLRHIDGYAQLLRKQAGAQLDTSAQRYLDNIGVSARNLGVLIDELLTFSRMGRAELRWLPVDMGESVTEVVRSLEPETQDRGITWQVAELPTVRADPTMLRQVWANLLGNAVKYTRHQPKPCIEITHSQNRTDGHVFSVRDNGAGFDMQYAAKLFGVFQRLHSANEFEGTGIGLANVRRIIQRHGGRTWAEGTVGAGATFHFSLPADGAAESVATVPANL